MTIPTRSSWVHIGAVMKVELFLWILCLGHAAEIAMATPFRAASLKDIYLGMKVELPSLTMAILKYSDLVTAWWFVMLPVLGLVFLGLLVGGGKAMIAWGTQEQQTGAESFARLQLMLTGILAVLWILLGWSSTFINQALTSPMLQLVSP
jgi:hypothetical protein